MATFAQAQAHYDNMEHPDYYGYDETPCCDGENETQCSVCGRVDKVFLFKISTHKARKDHFDEKGNLVVPKGMHYVATIKKGYSIDEHGDRDGFISYTKRLVNPDGFLMINKNKVK